jgi:hypothetical protein
MGLQIETIGKQFAELKRVGSTAEDLANTILDIYTKSKKTTDYFEMKIAEGGEFMNNFYAFGGQEAITYAQAVYGVLKEMNTKLEALG